MKYTIAASITLLLAVAGITLSRKQNTNDQLYAAYFSPDPGLPTTMSTTSNYDFYEAMVDYKRGNFDIAISKWNTLINQNPENDTLQYFLGVAHMANNQVDMAIPYLNSTTKQGDSKFISEAHYYLGLANLKVGKEEEARAALLNSDLSKSTKLLEELTQEK